MSPAQATLHDFLGGQLTLATQDPVDRLIGQTLIDLIDEAGYLSEPSAGTAERLGVSLARVEAVLRSFRRSSRRASARATSPSA